MNQDLANMNLMNLETLRSQSYIIEIQNQVTGELFYLNLLSHPTVEIIENRMMVRMPKLTLSYVVDVNELIKKLDQYGYLSFDTKFGCILYHPTTLVCVKILSHKDNNFTAYFTNGMNYHFTAPSGV